MRRGPTPVDHRVVALLPLLVLRVLAAGHAHHPLPLHHAARRAHPLDRGPHLHPRGWFVKGLLGGGKAGSGVRRQNGHFPTGPIPR